MSFRIAVGLGVKTAGAMAAAGVLFEAGSSVKDVYHGTSNIAPEAIAPIADRLSDVFNERIAQDVSIIALTAASLGFTVMFTPFMIVNAINARAGLKNPYYLFRNIQKDFLDENRKTFRSITHLASCSSEKFAGMSQHVVSDQVGAIGEGLDKYLRAAVEENPPYKDLVFRVLNEDEVNKKSKSDENKTTLVYTGSTGRSYDRKAREGLISGNGYRCPDAIHIRGKDGNNRKLPVYIMGKRLRKDCPCERIMRIFDSCKTATKRSEKE